VRVDQREGRADRDRFRSFVHDLRQYIATGLLLYGEDTGLTAGELRKRLNTGDRLFRQLSAVVDREVTDGAADALSTSVEASELVEECVALFRHAHPALDIRTVVSGQLEVFAEREGLHRALTNVLENAARAAGERGHVTVRAWSHGPHVCIEVSDDGRGFGQIARGTGHGIQTVDEVIRAAHGTLEIRSGPEAGTQVRLLLPHAVSGGTA
jgi:signal transduction histidine kinase